ncbi:hypothetical protein GCK72_005401 [Caenorhabditis remanei]|uniref:Uncharacterized protein n=1 Tax=Caenorhabditis remanei TaxID=31234 RepID=A0A6A5HEF0_CAERE|nr:hypothetical protein GCK72_005401 [Caenorhabditis remanei]KAF1765449.1 hypothetical protein GCK72_005401 [Caenorhabditis remanei]
MIVRISLLASLLVISTIAFECSPDTILRMATNKREKHSMDAVQEFMGDSMEKDRAEVVGKSSGITEDEKLTLIYEVFRQYFNIEFGQKVMDTVKYSMTERDWLIATADAAQYLKVENFNLVY